MVDITLLTSFSISGSVLDNAQCILCSVYNLFLDFDSITSIVENLLSHKCENRTKIFKTNEHNFENDSLISACNYDYSFPDLF